MGGKSAEGAGEKEGKREGVAESNSKRGGNRFFHLRQKYSESKQVGKSVLISIDCRVIESEVMGRRRLTASTVTPKRYEDSSRQSIFIANSLHT